MSIQRHGQIHEFAFQPVVDDVGDPHLIDSRQHLDRAPGWDTPVEST
jgi:hypothetical protein